MENIVSNFKIKNVVRILERFATDVQLYGSFLIIRHGEFHQAVFAGEARLKQNYKFASGPIESIYKFKIQIN